MENQTTHVVYFIFHIVLLLFTFTHTIYSSVLPLSWYSVCLDLFLVATSCCISGVSSQWEGAIFDPS